MTRWEDLVASLRLEPHPEGGYFRETYRSAAQIPHKALKAAGHKGARGFSTAIYYLLPAGAVSKLHRLKSDECFHFYLGGPMTLLLLGPEGQVERARLGPDVLAGQVVQRVAPAGWWFGGWCEEGGAFSLVGCTVAPAFDFADFEFGDREVLAARYPSARADIERLLGR